MSEKVGRKLDPQKLTQLSLKGNWVKVSPSGHMTSWWHQIDVYMTLLCRIDVSTTSSWRHVPSGTADYNPLVTNGFFYLAFCTGSIANVKGSSFNVFLLFKTVHFYDKECRPWSDATFVASDLGLHCLQTPFKGSQTKGLICGSLLQRFRQNLF